MSNKKSTQFYMRIIHRYLGFFLAGIMTVYALSGVLLIYRNTELLKTETQQNKMLKPSLTINEIGKELKMKDVELIKAEGDILYFKNGTYNTKTGAAQFTSKNLPYVLEKMTRLHKATTNEPLYWLNVFFGISLLFFAISSFWMFLPKTKTFRKGLYYTFGGIILTLIMLFI
ncbi:hypothetical protein [Lutibacter sp.]|uniref:hypothetical protein n=1 Tax=Lutibacter sp. TaxID=1925666 RepID=UPI0035621306